MSLAGYDPSDAEVEAGMRYVDARRRSWRMIPLMAVAALAVCWLPLGVLVSAAAWWSVSLVPAAVLFFAWWVFASKGRADGEGDVALEWLKTVRSADAPPLMDFVELVKKARATAR